MILRPAHLSVHVGDSLQHSKTIVEIWNCAFQCDDGDDDDDDDDDDGDDE